MSTPTPMPPDHLTPDAALAWVEGYQQGQRDALNEAADHIAQWSGTADVRHVVRSVVAVLRYRAQGGDDQ